ncbi:MAG: CTP synthase (glutamine hydrolyzing) [Candidatus Diapherotrites archaeon]|nr:CTP synthase (glutamine hydrolyzing) [Candidatus Diapherotrites archaeon]
MKFIVVTGGVLSGLGKGIVTSSLGKLLKARGYNVTPIKFDGYLNVDAGTMNPLRHGEVFVLDDGTECDMDLGNYERFLDVTMNYYNNPTGGKIFNLVLKKERRGEYLGVDVQFIPHVTGEIKEWVRKVGKESNADIVIIEVGGTIGDIENSYFVEAMRQLKLEEGENNVLFIHVTLVPILKVVGEQKTKPTQASVRELLHMGVQPDFVVCRIEEPLKDGPRRKIALYCNVKESNVISDHDCKTIYEVPFVLDEENFSEKVLNELQLPVREKHMEDWSKLVDNIKNPEKEVTIAITGKYTALADSYVSIKEALIHSGAHLKAKANIKWIETTDIENGKASIADVLKDVDGIIVPGGFGSRGTEGKIKCIQYARENNIPYLGLCFGFQMAVIEFARNVCGLEGAHSTEIEPNTKYPVIDIIPEQKEIDEKGGTMRLGAYPAILKEGSIVASLYGKTEVSERHRHRYEVNPDYIEILEKHGLVFSGRSPDGKLMEFLEIPDHKFFVGTQAHPEFKSRLDSPAPLFYGFLKACLK